MRFTATKDGDLAGIAKDLARAASKGQREAGRAVAAEGRKLILDDVRRARGGLRMMGGTLGVKATVEATDVSSTVELRATPAGPWHIVNEGTRAYDIKPKRRKVLAAGKGDVIGMTAHRRRTPGKDYWTGATNRLDAHIGDIVDEVVAAAMDDAG